MITQEEVTEAQKLWGEGVVKIGTLEDSGGECTLFTSSFLDDRYALESGTVLFKPTKFKIEQFRATNNKIILDTIYKQKNFGIRWPNRNYSEINKKKNFESSDVVLS